jgi:hypothetical protein
MYKRLSRQASLFGISLQGVGWGFTFDQVFGSNEIKEH